MAQSGDSAESPPPPIHPPESAEAWVGPLVAMLVVQTAVSFLSRIPPTLAPTLGPRVGWPAESVGYLTALISGGSIFVLLLAAPLQRRLGSMRTLQIGMALGVAGALLCALPSAGALVVGSLIIGLSIGPPSTAGMDVLQRYAPPSHRNLLFSVKQAGVPLGGVAAGLLLLYPPPVLSDAPPVLWVVVFAVGIFWISALTNAFNFMDGIDGFTGGVAIVNALFLIPLSGEAGALLPALIGATAGFLVWNISPASMFVGDSGAYLLGFSLAAIALYAPVPPGAPWTPLGFVAAALVFLPYLFDTAFTLFRRLRSGAGKNIFLAHREHIYQRITPTADLHRRTSNLYYAASVVAGLAALLISQEGAPMLLGIVVAAALCATLAALPRIL